MNTLTQFIFSRILTVSAFILGISVSDYLIGVVYV